MRITLLCSDIHHPINDYLKSWALEQKGIHEVDLIQKKAMAKGGEIIFLISCAELIAVTDREKYKVALVLHASDLPRGRGWSPHIWELLSGADFITLSLLEVEDRIDSGKIWKKIQIPIPKHALWNEVNSLLFAAEIELIDFAVKNLGNVAPTIQENIESATYYPKRTPEDSRLDINKTIAEQFNLLRVCDPNRFPAYFDYLGCRYILKLEKTDEL